MARFSHRTSYYLQLLCTRYQNILTFHFIDVIIYVTRSVSVVSLVSHTTLFTTVRHRLGGYRERGVTGLHRGGLVRRGGSGTLSGGGSNGNGINIVSPPRLSPRLGGGALTSVRDLGGMIGRGRIVICPAVWGTTFSPRLTGRSAFLLTTMALTDLGLGGVRGDGLELGGVPRVREGPPPYGGSRERMKPHSYRRNQEHHTSRLS